MHHRASRVQLHTEADVQSWIDTLVVTPNQTIPIPLTMGDDLMGIEGHTFLPIFRVGKGKGCGQGGEPMF